MQQKAFSVLILCAVSACDSGVDDHHRIDPQAQTCPGTVAAWDAPDYSTNAAVTLAHRAKLDALVGRMRDAELQVEFSTAAQLDGLLQSGQPSLASLADTRWLALLGDAFDEFAALTGAGQVDLINDQLQWTPGDKGGLFGANARGINPGGLEIRQLVDKGLFAGGALYRHALRLTAGEITPARVEALAAAWGSNHTLVPQGRTDSANYSYAMGYHARMAEALTAARSHAGDARCQAERDQALARFFRLWEESMVARTLHYSHLAHDILLRSVGDDDRADALHELTEGLALTIGFYPRPAVAGGPLAGQASLLSDAAVEAVLLQFRVHIGDLARSSTGLFVEEPAALAAAIAAAEAILAPIFSWTSDDLARFRAPTAG